MSAMPKSQLGKPLGTTPSLTTDEEDSCSDTDSESSDGSEVVEESNRQAMAAAQSSWKTLRADNSDDEDYFGLAGTKIDKKRKKKFGKEGQVWRQ
ncbi:hypothetical protein KC342_g17288 [Hortaea werneckii]|nr:hypothetical protein KC342_g17288 [Hortaea werneckii]KAI7380362.1 hypothetical protein KC328_g12838 [Hortaea werneckii]